MNVYHGRPKQMSGRSEREQKVYDFLDLLGIDYERADHEAAATIEACKEIDQALGVSMCKNLFLCNRRKTEYYLLLLPGEQASDEGIIRTDSYDKTVLRIRRGYGGISTCDAGLSDRTGVIVRYRPEGKASGG